MNRLLFLFLVGCGGEQAATWTDVAPIVERNCVSCHQEGGIGPMRLDDYATAALWSEAMAAATADRVMPPFLVRGDGECGDFRDNHWLTDDEIATIGAWADAGAPEGDGATVTPAEPPTLGRVDAEHQTPDFVPQIVGGDYAEFDEYRCFAVEIEGDGDRFLTGYDVVPGNDAIVHHVIGMPVDMDAEAWSGGLTNRETIANLSDPDREGWPCFSGAGASVSYSGEVIAWAPGQGAVHYPEGVGLRLPAGTHMVYQVHYNLSDPDTIGESDQTTIQLQTASSVQREAYLTLPDLFLGGEADQSFIPAGETATSVTFEMPMSWVLGTTFTFQVLGVLPHMHERGTQMYVSFVRRDGAGECIAEVQNWDFNWQRMYFYETPIEFNFSDTLKVECVYDTSDDTEPITPGWGTQNEMCLPAMLIAAGRG